MTSSSLITGGFALLRLCLVNVVSMSENAMGASWLGRGAVPWVKS
jgi:hypothetical protein